MLANKKTFYQRKKKNAKAIRNFIVQSTTNDVVMNEIGGFQLPNKCIFELFYCD